MKSKITQTELKKILNYDPKTGVFTWSKNAKRNKGKIAGTTLRDSYIRIKITEVQYMAHRLAWLYMTGNWPKNLIDHINLDRSDNKFANLREANHMQNSHNRLGKKKRGKVKYKGVYEHVKYNKYVAEIMHKGTRMYLGIFDTQEKARDAYVEASQKYHAEFGRTE